MATKPRRVNYFIQKRKDGLRAVFRSNPRFKPNTGFAGRATLKRVSKRFSIITKTGFSAEEKLVANKIFELLSKNEKMSYNELYSRVSSIFRKMNLKLGAQPINNYSVQRLYKN